MAPSRKGRGGLLSEAEFSQEVVRRITLERPEIDVKMLDTGFLVVEPARGKQRVVSVLNLYSAYVGSPREKDILITNFLANLVYDDPPGIKGSFEDNKVRILPQVVPPSLLEFCRRDGRELDTVAFTGDLSVAFVVDEPERYCYINAAIVTRWSVTSRDLLSAGLENLDRITRPVRPQHLGVGAGLMLVYESFDGYDASRILLSGVRAGLAARVPGQLVLGIPHRDYLVACGDYDSDVVARVQARVQHLFDTHGYPISPHLFTLEEGRVVPYVVNPNKTRIFN